MSAPFGARTAAALLRTETRSAEGVIPPVSARRGRRWRRTRRQHVARRRSCSEAAPWWRRWRRIRRRDRRAAVSIPRATYDSRDLIALREHALLIGNVVALLCSGARVSGSVHSGRGSEQEPATSAGSRAKRWIADGGTNGRAGGRAESRSDDRARHAALIRGLAGRRASLLGRPLTTEPVVSLELFE